MTILALDTAAVSSEMGKIFASNRPLSPQSAAQTWPFPRINLRKRSFSSKKMNLESVNSAFLSGLFADVANFAEDIPQGTAPPTKRVRISKSESMARCGRSFKVLTEALDEAAALGVHIPHSPVNVDNNSTLFENIFTMDRDDSLLFQIECVGASSTDVSSATSIAFPHLPATVSNSSCGNSPKTLTRVISDLQSSHNTEKFAATSNETYGWFVETEDESSAPSTPAEVAPRDPSASQDCLTFAAPTTTPTAENYDADLEWATAADTVDDVLGDFF